MYVYSPVFQAHSCVEKAGMISLVKIRELEIDESYALRGGTLQRAIDEDRKMGLIPFYVSWQLPPKPTHSCTIKANAACLRGRRLESGGGRQHHVTLF